MSLIDLEGCGQVVRYVKPTWVHDDGTVSGQVFQLRNQEPYLSINWLGFFKDCSEEQQLGEVKRLIRLGIKKSGRFAKLNVGSTIDRVQEELDSLRFVHCPLEADPKHEADPSHSGIIGLPTPGSPEAELIGDLIAQCVNETFLCSEIPG